jgi:DNA-binding beta-propeller fold protein YncE
MGMTGFLLRRLISTGIILALAGAAYSRRAAAPEPLRRVAAIDIPGITGDFDHLAADEKGGRLFVAGEDHKTMEVFDLKTGRHLKSVTGFGAPHAIFYLPKSNEIIVTDGGGGMVRYVNGTDYSFDGQISGLAGVDSARLDTSKGVLYAVTGGKDVNMDHSFLVALDLKSKTKISELRFASNHVEAFALDPLSSRLFINITDKGEVAVVDRQTMKEIGRWRVGVAGQNSPMIYDSPHKRLLIVCRKPAMLVVMDADSGRIVAKLPAAGRSDDVAFDSAKGLIYVPGGEGFVSVIHQDSADKYSLVANVPTAPGAKTSLLLPSMHRYYVAVSPGETKAPAQLLIFETNSD